MSRLKKTWLRHSIVFDTLVSALFFSVFVILNRVLPGQVTFHDLTTPPDGYFGFIPEWQVVYFFTVILPFFPLMYIHDRRIFRYFATYFCLTLVICYLFFIFFPVKMQRPEVEITGFFSWGVKVNHIADNPINCFPSFHVTVAFAVALTVSRLNRRLGYFFYLLATLISLSVLYVKAHFFVDVLGGIALAFGMYALYLKPRNLRLHRPRLTRPGAIYLFSVIFALMLATMYLVYRLDLIDTTVSTM